MEILGLQKTTLLDYPGLVAATLFTGGCNFSCPYCHNSPLIHPDLQSQESYSAEEVFSFLKKRKGILEGVCISGGEPTLQRDLEDFILQIRSLGLKVKLDTNGYRPQVLSRLLFLGLLDYVAMDIKASPSAYGKVCGVSSLAFERIEESVQLLMKGSIPYEFRTTVVSQLHSPEQIRDIGKWLAGARAYYIQPFRDSDTVPCRDFSAPTAQDLKEYLKIASQYIPNSHIRGTEL